MEHIHVCDCVAIPVRIKVLGWVAGSGWSRELTLMSTLDNVLNLSSSYTAPRNLCIPTLRDLTRRYEFAQTSNYRKTSDIGNGVHLAQTVNEHITVLSKVLKLKHLFLVARVWQHAPPCSGFGVEMGARSSIHLRSERGGSDWIDLIVL